MTLTDAGQRAFLQALGRPTILCDVDETIAMYCSAACEAVNGAFGTSYTPQMWRTFGGPLTGEQRQWLEDARHTDGAFWLAMAPDTIAVEALRALGRAGFPIILSSNRPAEQKAPTAAWVDYWRLPHGEIHLVGPGGKEQIASQYGPERPLVVIDDKPAMWASIPRPGITLWSPRRPYTPSGTPPPGVTVFDSWLELLTGVGM